MLHVGNLQITQCSCGNPNTIGVRWMLQEEFVGLCKTDEWKARRHRMSLVAAQHFGCGRLRAQ